VRRLPWPACALAVRWSWSEPRRDREEEAPRRRIRAEVDVAHDRLLAVVRDLRVIAEVVGKEQQVASGDTDARVARAQPGDPPRWQVERDARLAQLEECRGLNERTGRTVCIAGVVRSEEHTSELQSRGHLVCRLLLEKKKVGRSELRPDVTRRPWPE